jgi:hypothetical protein
VNIQDQIIADFVTKQYDEIDLSELGERYKDAKLPVWVNPPGYSDAINARNGFDINRWMVETFYENPNGTKVFTPEKIKEMSDPLLRYLGDKAAEKYTAYRATIKNSSGG